MGWVRVDSVVVVVVMQCRQRRRWRHCVLNCLVLFYTRTDINGMGGGNDDLCYGFSRWILRLSVMLLLCVHGQAAFYMGICVGIV